MKFKGILTGTTNLQEVARHLEEHKLFAVTYSKQIVLESESPCLMTMNGVEVRDNEDKLVLKTNVLNQPDSPVQEIIFELRKCVFLLHEKLVVVFDAISKIFWSFWQLPQPELAR